jgi:hypothetical protein
MTRLGWITDLRAPAAAAAGTGLLALALPLPAGLLDIAAAAAGLALVIWAGVSLRRQFRASLTWCPACRGTVALRAGSCRHCGQVLHGAPSPARDGAAPLTAAGRSPLTPLL